MPAPLTPTLTTTLPTIDNLGVFTPRFEPIPIPGGALRSIAAVPPAILSGDLSYGGVFSFAWLEGCADVISLKVITRAGGAIYEIGLNLPALVAFLVFPESQLVGQAIVGGVGLDAQIKHSFYTPLAPGPYRVYAISGEALIVDETNPIAFLACGLDAVDIQNLTVTSTSVSFRVALSAPGRVAAAVIPRVVSGSHGALSGWFSGVDAITHDIALPAPVGQWRVIVFGSREPLPA